jgi:site-specific DNA-methyltransferase (adenine-specific)
MRDLLNKVTQGDCLEVSEQIESGSVDLILTDLPYGNMNTDGGRKLGINGWDFAIEPSKVYETANRILRPNGKMLLFSQEPYTSELIKNAIPNIPFSYRAIWEKDNFANALGVNKAMVSMYEDVLIFSKTHPKHDFEGFHPLRRYFRDVIEFIGLPKRVIIEKLGQRADHVFRSGSTQFSLCTEETYNAIVSTFDIDEMGGFKRFSELKAIDTMYRQSLIKEMNEKYPSVFNLWEGNKYKSNILKYKKDYDGFHPTQKPTLLLEDLIKTFSNEGDLIVDLTCGSGSTGVASINTNRQFIGIEREPAYVEIANKRIAEALAKI